jgi:hypothetical protein
MKRNAFCKFINLLQEVQPMLLWLVSEEPRGEQPPAYPRRHGFARGDRVVVSPISGLPPTNFGHVREVKPGCRDSCRVVCALVAVDIEGDLPDADTWNFKAMPGVNAYQLDLVQHAD